MKITFSLALLSVFGGVYSAVPVPKGTGIASVSLPNTSDLRIYHQDGLSNSGIKEISTKLPTSPVLNDGFIFGGPTRANTPLAAVSWSSGSPDPEVSQSVFAIGRVEAASPPLRPKSLAHCTMPI